MDAQTLAVLIGYINKQVEKAKKEGFKIQVEQDRSILDKQGEEKVFYFLPKSTAKPSDGYDEFVYTNNTWEWIGKTDVDLSNYALKNEIPTKTSDLLNDSGFLTQHQNISNKVDKELGKGLSTNDYTNDDKAKLTSIDTYVKNKIFYTTPQVFGAKADGVSDDTEAIIRAIESANTVYFPKGVYKVHGSPINDSSAGIIIPSNHIIIMDDNAVILKSETKLLENIFITAVNAENITIRGGTIRGDRLYKQQNLTAAEYVTYSHNSSGILIQAGKNIRIENVHIDSIAGDGIMLLNSGNDICENIYLNNCIIEKSHRSNLWIAGAKNIYIKNCHFNYGGYRFDENGDSIIRDDFLDGASQSIIDNLSERQIYSIVEIDGVEHIQINGTNPRAGINLEHANGEKIYISDSHFEGNDTNDLVINNTYDELYISNCDFSSRITSVRNTATDKIVFSGSKIKNILLHGEVLTKCIITGEAWITRSGSHIDFCEIKKMVSNCNENGETIISNSSLNSVEIGGSDVSTVFFNHCDFLFSHSYDTFFHGEKTVMLNCSVRFNSNYENTVTPFYNIKNFIAKNTNFEMSDNLISQNVEGLFKTISSSVGFISLENCVFDINPYIGRILHKQTHSAVAVNNTVINHNSFGSFNENPENYIIHGNVFKNKPAKISDFENDSDYVNTTSMNQAIQTAIGGIENGSY